MPTSPPMSYTVYPTKYIVYILKKLFKMLFDILKQEGRHKITRGRKRKTEIQKYREKHFCSNYV